MERAQHGRREASKRAEQPSTRALCVGMLVGGLVAFAPGCRNQAEETVAPLDIIPTDGARPAAPPSIEELGIRVIHEYPHATDAFTQGLIWHEGVMYESTGQYGRSSLRKVQLEDGKVLTQRDLDRAVFGEGLALVDDRLIQLTWRAGLAFVSDLATLEERTTLRYRGEGWGLCYDGTALVMSVCIGGFALPARRRELLVVLRLDLGTHIDDGFERQRLAGDEVQIAHSRRHDRG